MIVVSNTTPLRYLLAIRHEHLLGELFARVHIPSAVFEELTNSRTPALVQQSISSKPSWLEVHQGQEQELPNLPRLVHRGERQAIALAELLHADLLLIDEKDGRTVAANRSFKLTGTLGVLEMAKSLGLIPDFTKTVESLLASGFYLKPLLLQELLNRNNSK